MDERVTVRMDRDTGAMLRAYAEAEGVSVSEVARRAVAFAMSPAAPAAEACAAVLRVCDELRGSGGLTVRQSDLLAEAARACGAFLEACR